MKWLPFFILIILFSACSDTPTSLSIVPDKGFKIAIIGDNLAARMQYFPHFETSIQQMFPEHEISVRNFADPADTPGMRTHSSRDSMWAFPGAVQYYNELANPTGSQGHYASPDEWLHSYGPDMILAFFGGTAAYDRAGELDTYRAEFSDFVDHSTQYKYQEDSTILVVVSPIRLREKSGIYNSGHINSTNLLLDSINHIQRTVCREKGVSYVDLLDYFQKKAKSISWTYDGFQLNNTGYKIFSDLLFQSLFDDPISEADESEQLAQVIHKKNWYWHQYYQTPNGVHVHGRRFEPYGPENYPAEQEKWEQIVAVADSNVWAVANARPYDFDAAVARTRGLPEVETNYPNPSDPSMRYLYGEEAIESFSLPPGFKIELFASEKEFPDLANPVQLSFDSKGRLWVATMTSYPHMKPGDGLPNDKLLILEDTDGDGQADKQTVFADSLHLPVGFEIMPEGVYVTQAPHLILISDTDKDNQADLKKIILSGFDDHDTHHAISAFCTDPSGGIFMCEGVFLHSHVETYYGPVRGSNGGFYRYDPGRNLLERIIQVSIPNPWGVAFDHWGQGVYLETSGPGIHWMLPVTMKQKYGHVSPHMPTLIDRDHRVRPTSGIEFIYSRHFPDEYQGDFLVNNTIGFLGTKQHTFKEDTTGFYSNFRQDLISSSDPNFRPVDLEMAPDGSLYLVDWHNRLIGHMQHNARDPLRDHEHGRIYRITYPERQLVEPPIIAEASIRELLDNLKLPEYRARYRSKKELRKYAVEEVYSAIQDWKKSLDSTDTHYSHHLLEALWSSQGIGKVDVPLLKKLLSDSDYRVRSAATQVVRYGFDQLDDGEELLIKSASDPNNRVRLTSIVSATWLPYSVGQNIISEAGKHPLDRWMMPSYRQALALVHNSPPPGIEEEKAVSGLSGSDLNIYMAGRELYHRDGYCGTCHQKDGLGLEGLYPPLSGTEYVTGDPERLIKIALHGMIGPMEVNGIQYKGQVPMTAYKNLMNDKDIAAVLSYIRNAFDNSGSLIKPETVAEVRKATENQEGFYRIQDLK